MKIQNWQIEVTSDLSNIFHDYFSSELLQNTQLLNTDQDSFNLLEKYVYDISMFHFNRLNIEYNSNIHYIEFWCKTNVYLNSFHFDCDEYEKKMENKFTYPLLSNIIYLNDSIYPTVITDVDLEKYKYKEFQNESNITVIFPKKNKHITFNGSKMHGVASIFDEDKTNEPRYIIAINLWDRKPTNIEYYQKQQTLKTYNNKTPVVKINPCNEVENVIIVKDVLNYDFFENLFYENKNACSVFSDLLKTDFYENDVYIFKIEQQNEEKNKEITRDEKMILDYENIKTIDNISSNNRFLQRFILNNIYSPDTCSWIINESELYAKENGGWTTNRHKKYPTTDIPIDKIKPIFKYVLGSIPNIMTKIYKYYCIPESIPINIVDLFIVKYEKDAQNKLEIHTDGSFITFSIMLSSSKDYEGGGTEFNDGIQVFLERGDVLVHSGYVKHSGLEVTRGTRYILVAFTSITINENNILKPN
jgi:hypothetical protein